MVIHVASGNLLDSDAQTLVNTVNCVGAMGKGIALEFRKRFPAMYADYVAKCRAGQVALGRPYLYRPLFAPYILNFPTKGHWRSPSRLVDIEAGLDWLTRHYEEWGITSLAVPALGCGNGGLEWSAVEPVLCRYLDELTIPIQLYPPQGLTPAQLRQEASI